MPEIYVSTDVEADGPIPGPNSMLSFGSAAYAADKTLIGTFSANLLSCRAPNRSRDDGVVEDAARRLGGVPTRSA